jgi:signal transduction histidine kinase/DNA-binding response OmpR family regulator
MKNQVWKISIKQIIFWCIVVALILLSFAVFIQNNSKRATMVSVESLKDATSQSTQRIDEILSRAKQEICLTADLYEQMLENEDVTTEDLEILTAKSPFDRIEFADVEGEDMDQEGVISNVSSETFFQDGMKGHAGIDVVFDSSYTEERLVVFYSPLYYEDVLIGVLHGVYTESQVEEILSSSFFGEASRTFLCLRDGTVIARCGTSVKSSDIFAKGNFKHTLDTATEKQLRKSLKTGQDYQFQYQGTAGKGNAYVTSLDSNDWMLIQTFPSQVTAGFIQKANKAGIQLLLALVSIFAVCLLVVFISSKIQRKKLISANNEKAYVIHGVTQIFKIFVRIDIKNNTYSYLAGTRPRNGNVPLTGNYDGFVEYVSSMAEDSEKESLCQFLSLESLQKNMDEETDSLRYEYLVNAEYKKWDSINLFCMRREKGKVVEILLAGQDVTRIKEREQKSYQALKEAYQAVESANQAKVNFLSNMSHDIRTPMNAIMGMTAIAAMNLDNTDRVKDCLNKITVSSQHLLGLINEVLDMSKIESGKLVFSEEEFNLSDVVDRIVTMFLPQTQEKNQQFKVNVLRISHEEVIGDSMRLQQIFINILGNAVKFTPEDGEITLQIEETASSMHGYGCYVFTVEDNGIGMEEEFLDKIFEPFVRADNSRVGKVEGTGLGMSIVKNIIQMMSGDIQVESKLGEGSKFTVTVYLQLNRFKNEDVSGLENLSVLVADDDEFACENACSVLTEIGMDSHWVTSGQEAVDTLMEAHEQCKDYAAVILDWKMPGKDGLETTREIRSKLGEEVPIIILSAFDYTSIEQEAREAGVNAFISKPLFRSRLVYVMKSLMLGEQEKDTELECLQDRNYTDKKVLLVEDNELNMEIAQELLEQTGVTVDKAENGQLAAEKLRESPEGYYDLVFMDIQMPVMDGYEATKVIRSSQRKDLQTIPIVAMTADAFTDDVARAKMVGMNGHLSKPVEINKLLDALDRWLH